MPRKTEDRILLDQARAARLEAAKLAHGAEREALERTARRLETAARMKDWLTSPGLKPPS